ncbi:MAG: uracil-DNA glycosylase [Chloroflexi bacterium]|nr:uracil-DNA glycosylase [Chloroflexota bacterium]MDA1271437.1 uracil-DNA glycosylase [Chloroflexota bacterium]PKB58978.1 MAG: hypothetical protein BZY83_04310 [SAR202 cluster bacterium Casp-Chloro-G2]
MTASAGDGAYADATSGMPTGMETLDQVAALVRGCQGCSLAGGRTNAVPGEGNPKADVMFIGEGPGAQEDRQGRPFVGPAGKLLDGLLASMGANRQDVFIANMVKCRPPGNRDPAPAELAACTKYLDRQVELVNPKLIVTLGRFAFNRYFPGEGITKARGKLREIGDRKIFPVLHPAAVLRRDELRPTMVKDFEAIAEILAEGPKDTEKGPGGVQTNRVIPATPQATQLSLMDAPDPAAFLAPVEALAPEIPADAKEGPLSPEQLTLF